MAKTLGNILNAALVSIKEPEITALTSTNILQVGLINELNNSVRDILSRGDFSWGLKHDAFATSDDLATGTVAATHDSTTVTSSGDYFTGAAAGWWLRLTNDTTSYEIATVTTSGSPDTLTLADNFIGTTTTSSGYRLFKDTYGLPFTDLDEVVVMAYGNAQTWTAALVQGTPDNQIRPVDMSTLLAMSGGDLHRDTSGRPKFFSRMAADSSEYPQYVLWPFPTGEYLIHVWYMMKYSAASAFSTVVFGSDAPLLAEDAVEYRVKATAHLYERQNDMAEYWMGQYNLAIANMIRREKQLSSDQAMKVQTYRQAFNTFPVRSGVFFDTKSSLWR